VLGVFGEDLGQMLVVEDQHLVEYLAAERSDNPLADRVRPWGLRRNLDDPDAASSEDLIEGGDELGVPVTDQEPQLTHPRAQLHGQVPGLLCHPWPGRVRGDAGHVQPAGAVLDEYQYIQALQRDGVHRGSSHMR
jgi:hypothetical protein